MEKHCTRVFYSLRKSKVAKDGTVAIEVIIAVNAERVSFNSGKRILYSEWNKDKQIVRGNSESVQLINEYLIQFRNKILEKEIELIRRGYTITPSLLRDAVLGKMDELAARTILQLHDEFNAEKKKLVGKTVAKATYYVFEHSRKMIAEFMELQYKRKDMLLSEVKYGFIQSYHAYLIGDRKMCQNTTTKYLKFLKSLINRAVSNGYLQYNVLNAYKVEREPVDMDFLTHEELQKVINFDTPIPRLEKARDFFLFGCFTGLSYIDIKTLATEHFERDDDGRIWIKKKRVKTGILSRIPLLPMAKLILDKYKGGDKLMPIQDPSDINKYLKDIALYCGINKHVTFHTSRHTFATTVTLANNISLEVIAKMMGHTNTRMTSHYAKLIDKCIAEEMDKLETLLSAEHTGNSD